MQSVDKFPKDREGLGRGYDDGALIGLRAGLNQCHRVL
jgi:hypothetical protein